MAFNNDPGIKPARIPDVRVPQTSPVSFDLGSITNALSGAITSVVGAKDTQNQDAIEQRIRQEAELSTDIVTNGQYSAQTDINAPANSDSVPRDLAQSLKRLDVLKTAYGQGKVNETGYWARLNAVAKELRVKYPNYDEVIDSKFSKITGQVPGNALRNQIINTMEADARAKSSADKAWEANIEDFAKNAVLHPRYLELQNTEEGRAAIRKYAYEGLAANARVNQRKAALELNKAEGENMEDNAYGTAGKILEERTNFILNSVLSNVGEGGGMQGLLSLVTKAKADNVVTADEQAAITSYLAQIEGSVSSALDAEIHQNKDGSGRTLASYFKNRQKIEDLKKIQMDRLQTFKTMVTDQQYGLLSFNKAYLEALQNGELINLQTNDQSGDFARRMKALRELGGDTAVNALLIQNMPKFKKLTDVATTGAATIGAVTTPEGGAPPAKALAGASPKASKATVEMIRGFIEHPDATPEAISNIVSNVFGKGETDFVGSFNRNDQIKAFKALTAPSTVQKIAELSKTNPEAYKNYKAWFYNTTNNLLSQAVIDLGNLKGEDMEFDGKQVTISKPTTGYFKPAQGAAPQPVKAYLRQHVEDINAVLSSWRTFAEASGKDGDAAVKELFSDVLRLDPNKPREKSGAEKMFESLGKWLSPETKETVGKGVSRRPQ